MFLDIVAWNLRCTNVCILLYYYYKIPNFEGPTLKNKNYKIFTFWGPGGQSWGSKPTFFKWYEIRTLTWESYQILKVLRSKTKIFKFWLFGCPGRPSGGPEPKFFNWYEIRAQKWVSYQYCFEGSTIKNKNVKFWHSGGLGGPNGGPEPKFFNWYDIRAQKLVSYQILKVLRSKTKILKFWPFGGPGGPNGAPNQNFSTDMKSGPKNEYHIKFWRFYVQKQKF